MLNPPSPSPPSKPSTAHYDFSSTVLDPGSYSFKYGNSSDFDVISQTLKIESNQPSVTQCIKGVTTLKCSK